eukprot:TRINITY_DN7143_c0_g1_i1.p1 TRINITY_DN7143_c0_g1~~TRINITY_DN7143_c0_g1_i1.p1  ORF type:complete len:110 (-),score=18.75 TRINITY_DN7143_c0_g1_i1:457-786(-)
MNFCRECNNMLYPHENEQDAQLELVCRNCEFIELAENKCIFTHHTKETEEEKSIVWGDVAADLTLPRTYRRECEKCSEREAVLYLIRSKEAVSLYFVCANPSCYHRWKN